jgi:hypothetical protein
MLRVATTSRDALNARCDVITDHDVVLLPLCSDLSNEALETGICKNEIRPKIPSDCLPSLKKLMEDCWHDNPERVRHRLFSRLLRCFGGSS